MYKFNKALFVGLGGVGQRHLRNLLSLIPDIKIGAVRSVNRTFEIGHDMQADTETNINSKYNIELFPDLISAARWQPDFAVISSPTNLHLSQATCLVEYSIPVFLEKPIASKWAGLPDLVNLSKKTKVPVMVGYMMRFHPGIQRLFKLLRERCIGDLHAAHFELGSYMPSWHNYEKYNEFYAGRSDLGGGAVLSEIHEIDLMHAMFGLPKRLMSLGGKLSKLDIDVEDTVRVLLDYRIDKRPLPISLGMSFVQRPIGRSITIWGEGGRLSWDMMAQKLIHWDEDKGEVNEFATPDYERNEMFISEISHFLGCLENDSEPATAIAKVAGSQLMAMKIKESLESGEIVAFD